jgi:hypothetical protein
MAQRLEIILGSPDRPARASLRRRPIAAAAATELNSLSELIHSGPKPPLVRRFGPVQRLARQGLLRLVKPITARQREIDLELLAAIDRLDGELRSLAASDAAAIRQIDQHRRLGEHDGESPP